MEVPGIDLTNLKFTDHALQRARQRFNKNQKDAVGYFKKMLEEAIYRSN